MGRLSLSKKEVAQIHMVLAALPIPPIPVLLELSSDGISDVEKRQAFDMATCQLKTTSVTDDKILNTHMVFAALMLTQRWTQDKNDENSNTRKNIKDKCILQLMDAILHIDKESKGNPVDTDVIQRMFVQIANIWIQGDIPVGAVVVMSVAPMKKIHHEHNLHVSMSHYCCAQGTMYSSKGSLLVCDVHRTICEELEQTLNTIKENPDDDVVLKVDAPLVRDEAMEKSELYSKFEYQKLLILCYQRILKDVLYGYNNVDTEQLHKNAEELLSSAIDNYEKIHNIQVDTQKTQNEKLQTKVDTQQLGNVNTDDSGQKTQNQELQTKVDTQQLGNVNTDDSGQKSQNQELQIKVDTQQLGNVNTDDSGQKTQNQELQTKVDTQQLGNVNTDDSGHKSIIHVDTQDVVLSFNSTFGIFINEITNCCDENNINPIWYNGLCISLEHIEQIQKYQYSKYVELLPILNINTIIKLVRKSMTVKQKYISIPTYERLSTILYALEIDPTKAPV